MWYRIHDFNNYYGIYEILCNATHKHSYIFMILCLEECQCYDVCKINTTYYHIVSDWVGLCPSYFLVLLIQHFIELRMIQSTKWALWFFLCYANWVGLCPLSCSWGFWFGETKNTPNAKSHICDRISLCPLYFIMDLITRKKL